MNISSTPAHAVLPLWRDRDDQGKKTQLSLLIADLEIYAAHYGQNISIEQKKNWSLLSADDAHTQVMHAYDKLLGSTRMCLLSYLNQMVPYDLSEHVSRLEAESLILANPNVINMNCEAGHVTGSGLIVDIEQRKVLLHLHKKLGRWLQFGGHPDYETSIIDVAIRETKEESGFSEFSIITYLPDPSIPIDIDMQAIPEAQGRPAHSHADMRFIFATDSRNQLHAATDESDKFWWLQFDEALAQPETIIDASVKRLITKAFLMSKFDDPNRFSVPWPPYAKPY